MKKTDLIIAILVFILAILLILIYFSFNEKSQHQPSFEKEEEKIIETDEMEKIKKLYNENNDLVGYIIIEDTKIDYPVMYTKGEDFYLYRDFYKNKYSPGTLFVDKYNQVEPRDTNLIIHGHNMTDGTMFHDLEKFLDEDFYKTHKTFTFYTLKEKETYEIVSVFKSKVYNVSDNVFKYYKFYNASNEKEFDDFISNVKKLELYNTGVTAKFNESLLTLSTCEYSKENGRLVVLAKKSG